MDLSRRETAPPEGGLTVQDPWRGLRALTPARIALGRAGGSQPTAALLDFRLSHAKAKDAVAMAFDPGALARELEAAGIASKIISTRAKARGEYLLRPDLGRALSDASRGELGRMPRPSGRPSVVFIVSDGLAALAAQRHAGEVLRAAIPALEAQGWGVFPVLIAPFARVKLQDEAGALLGADAACMLLGERPGLGVPDSLGAYFTWGPSAEKTDADRNCLSNIRPEGFAPAAAASKLVALLCEARRLGISGVGLKDTLPAQSAEALPV